MREAAVFFGLDVVQVSAKNYGADLAELEGLEVMLELNRLLLQLQLLEAFSYHIY